MPRRSHESLGDYISSACFGGVGFMAFINGLEALSSGQTLRAIIILIVSFFLFLAVFRYAIARITDQFHAKNSKKTK